MLSLDPEHRQVVSYGLSVLASNLFGLAVVLFIAYLLESLVPTLALVAALLFLRPHAGGAHCSSSFNCNLFGFVFMPLLGYGSAWLAKCPPAVAYLYFAAAVLLVFRGILLNAPYFTQVKPRAEARRQRLKYRSLAIAAALSALSFMALILNNNSWGVGVATGLLFQGMMLLPVGINGIQLLDGLLNRVVLRKRG
ncbi:MAG TPA: accessory gene regulator B family protein [Bacillota bacterium]|nr:accessory gene regulator B family protein [Bacillota bacterium]